MEVLRHIRAFFTEEGYLEADTPLLAPYLIPEAHIEVFETRFIRPEGGSTPLYLIPSPELWMKRLLASGSGSIFQIGHCFRNHESVGAQHNPEFTMLEWYTVGAGYLDSVSVAERLIGHVARGCGLPQRLSWQGREVDLRPPFRRLTMGEAFRQFADLDLDRCADAEVLRGEARRRGIPCGGDEPWDDVFHRIFLTLVEPELPADRPLVLLDYPGTIPTLARRKPESLCAERWELYIAGLELANCYTEETDPGRLEEFIRAESAKKEGCRVPHAIDGGLPQALRAGFPPCSGVALGLDRLLMLLTDQESIEGVIFFPFSDMMAALNPVEGREATPEKGRV